MHNVDKLKTEALMAEAVRKLSDESLVRHKFCVSSKLKTDYFVYIAI